MSWCIVVQPNGMLACFSDLVDDFHPVEMTADEAEYYCHAAFRLTPSSARQKVQQGLQRGRDGWDAAIAAYRRAYGESFAEWRTRTLSQPLLLALSPLEVR